MRIVLTVILLVSAGFTGFAQTFTKCDSATDFFSLKDTTVRLNSVYRTWDIRWYYDKAGPDLSDSITQKTLYAIAHFIRTNRNAVVEISVYLDCSGSSEYNLKLSEMRARSLWIYFTSIDVNGARIKYKGYGENCPLVPCDKIMALPENQRSIEEEKNRRLEIKILRTDYRQ